MTASRSDRIAGAVAITAVGIAAAVCARQLTAAALAEPRLPRWDPSAHLVDGLRLADALTTGDVAGLVAHVYRLSLWPPVFPLVEAPVLALLGSAPTVAVGLMATLFALAAVAACAAGLAAGGRMAAVTGAMAGSLLLASPTAALYGSVTMLELPGALVLLLALTAYLRSLASARMRDARLAFVLTTLLFFTKYNYGLVWLLALAACEASRRGSWLATARSLGPVRWRSPFTLLVAVWLLVIALIAATGGGVFELGGRRISMRSIGSPAYLLLLLLSARAAWSAARTPAAARTWWRRLDPRQRAFLGLVVAPILAWLLLPPHGKDFFTFLHNRPSGLPPWTAESLLFYPRSFLADDSPSAALGVAVSLLAVAPFAVFRRLGRRRQVVLIVLAVSALAAGAHPLKETRFFFTTAVLVWLAAAGAVADLLERVLGDRWRPIAAIVLAVAIAGMAALSGIEGARLQTALAQHSVSPAVGRVAERALALAATAPASVLAGYWDGFSPALVEWHARRARPATRHAAVPMRPGALADPNDPTGFVAAVHARPEGIVVLVLDPTAAHTAGARRENPWLASLAAALAADPRLRLVADEQDPHAGYRLRAWSRLRPG